MSKIYHLCCLLALFLLTNCVKDATSDLQDLKGLTGQYQDVSALVRNITNTSQKLQITTIQQTNFINSLNQLQAQLRFISDWKKGRTLFKRLIDITNTIANPKGGSTVELASPYPTVDVVRVQIDVIKAFVMGFERYLEVLPPNLLKDYTDRLEQANNMLANINSYTDDPER